MILGGSTVSSSFKASMLQRLMSVNIQENDVIACQERAKNLFTWIGSIYILCNGTRRR